MTGRRSRLRSGGRGRGRLRLLVILSILAGLVYAGKLYGEPYWTYLSMFDPVKEAAMTAAARSGGPEKALEQLQARARAEGLELGEDAIQIIQNDSEVVVRANWDVPIDMILYPHTLHFSIEKRQPAI
jgi:hypothetical protein